MHTVAVRRLSRARERARKPPEVESSKYKCNPTDFSFLTSSSSSSGGGGGHASTAVRIFRRRRRRERGRERERESRAMQTYSVRVITDSFPHSEANQRTEILEKNNNLFQPSTNCVCLSYNDLKCYLLFGADLHSE